MFDVRCFVEKEAAPGCVLALQRPPLWHWCVCAEMKDKNMSAPSSYRNFLFNKCLTAIHGLSLGSARAIVQKQAMLGTT